MQSLIEELKSIRDIEIYGRVASVQGLLLEVAGPVAAMSVGARLLVEGTHGRNVPVEVVGFRDDRALCMPYGALEGVRMGCKVQIVSEDGTINPGDKWLGRVVNAMGEPVDGKGPLEAGMRAMHLKASPPPAHRRMRVGEPIDLGVRAINTFLTCCGGQRMGIFAGSGVGKSVLLSMLARWTECDVAVIGLIGERGREVQEFVEDDLGPEGLARSVVVVATSDEPALMRRQAAWTTLAIAEHFRDRGLNVLCLMDSVTRFAMAQREIGLASGEPPATKGYTPTVFAELPRLLERAGPGLPGQGSITGLFTVLVDGDDHNEPVADAVRGILDGHVVITRKIAERGRYPAIDLLKSVSRTLPHCLEAEQNQTRLAARSVLSTYADMEDIVRLGAYKQGSNPAVDRAVAIAPKIETMLTQTKSNRSSVDEAFAQLSQLVEGNDENAL